MVQIIRGQRGRFALFVNFTHDPSRPREASQTDYGVLYTWPDLLQQDQPMLQTHKACKKQTREIVSATMVSFAKCPYQTSENS